MNPSVARLAKPRRLQFAPPSEVSARMVWGTDFCSAGAASRPARRLSQDGMDAPFRNVGSMRLYAPCTGPPHPLPGPLPLRGRGILGHGLCRFLAPLGSGRPSGAEGG